MSDPTDLEALARRYLDLWQEQVSALAADRDFADMMQRWMSAMGAPDTPNAGAPEGGTANGATPWAAAWAIWPAMMAGLTPATAGKRSGDGSNATGANGSGPGTEAGTEAKDGTAATAAAPLGGRPDLDELTRRLAALEERVAALEKPAPRKRERARRRPAGR